MTGIVDGRPYRLDVTANIDRDSYTIAIAGFPASYLTGATITAPIRSAGGVTTVGSWTVAFNGTLGTIDMSLPQSALAAIGQGAFDYVLLATLADLSKPPLLAGLLRITRGGKLAAANNASVTVELVDTGAEITITQILGSGVTAIDGGIFGQSQSDSIDGGSL